MLHIVSLAMWQNASNLLCNRAMNRKQSLATLLVTGVVMYLVFFPKYQLQGDNQALNASNVCLLEAKENVDVTRSLLTYGSSKDATEFSEKPSKGARVLLLAYAR